jgi:ADP-ribose pyrophosphatase YjhB (NUDIX family)
VPVVLVVTNVWVSAFINPHGHPAKLKDAWLNQQFQVVVSVPLLDEIAEVLARPRIRNKYHSPITEPTMDPHWLDWAKRLQALAQTGLAYSKDPFDIERFKQVREIAVEIVAAHTDEQLATVRDLFMSEAGYATPKLDVRGAVFRADAILLVKERSDGRWTLPGGWIDINESPAEAVVREIFEESGYHTRAMKLLAVYDRNKHAHPPMLFHAYKIFFQCEIVGGAPSHSIETDGVGFYGLDELPDLSVARVTAAQIARLFEHYRHPEWPTDFD